MSTTHLSLHYHVVFSTKERRPLISDDWRNRMHEFLGGTVRQAGGIAEAIGGTEDHVHLLIGLRATHSLAAVIKDIKTASSRWAHTEMQKRLFSWQRGYGAFTVSPSQMEKVKNYVLHQESHHGNRTFQEEYIELLQLAAIEYDEEYLW